MVVATQDWKVAKAEDAEATAIEEVGAVPVVVIQILNYQLYREARM